MPSCGGAISVHIFFFSHFDGLPPAARPRLLVGRIPGWPDPGPAPSCTPRTGTSSGLCSIVRGRPVPPPAVMHFRCVLWATIWQRRLCSDDVVGIGHQCLVLRRVGLGDHPLRSRFGISFGVVLPSACPFFSLDLLSFCASIFAVLLTCLAFATAPTMLWAFFIT